MRIDAGQLEALAAVVGEGTFDAAARRLHVTPSAVSQRIKALEQSVGQVLVRRTRPCAATAGGDVLIRLAGQLAFLEDEALRALGGGRGGDGSGPPGTGPISRLVRVPVAVNADSLSTWFPAVFDSLPDGVLLDLRREDQDHSAALLRDGSVMAAVTADARAVQGCRVRPLGAMRYLAVAAPSYVARWLGGAADAGSSSGPGPEALAVAPLLTFNRKDALQERFLRLLSPRWLCPPVHYVPSSSAFLDLVRQGVGWGMVPDVAVAEQLERGALVELAPGRHLDVPLYWQHWKLETATLDAVTGRVLAAADAALHPPGTSARAGAAGPPRGGRTERAAGPRRGV